MLDLLRTHRMIRNIDARNVRRTRLIYLVALAAFLFSSTFSIHPSEAQTKTDDDQYVTCAAYISGIGCSNCAVTDPVVFAGLTEEYPDYMVIEYEIYKNRDYNRATMKKYYANYLPEERIGVPFLIFNKEFKEKGRYQVLKATQSPKVFYPNPCPMPDGTSVEFKDLDLTKMPGKFNVWTKNRVLLSGKKGNNDILKKLLLVNDISDGLRNVPFEKIDPHPVPISRGKLDFEFAVKVGDWVLQWNGEPLKISKGFLGLTDTGMVWIFIGILILVIMGMMVQIRMTKKGVVLNMQFAQRRRDYIVVGISLLALLAFFITAKNVSPDFLEKSGYAMPLPVFTFCIALVDGFNPCNMFVLTCLLALLISTSDSRRRLYIVAFSFVGMVFIIYFFFMAAWLNIFKYVSFVTPLRIGIAVVALIAGFINCKELLFFKKGISLTIQEKHKLPLFRKMNAVKEIIKSGSMPLLVSSSIGLAALASLIELPCTAGFPIIYTGVLSGKVLKSTVGYYGYLFLYNFVYVIPLLVIVTIFIYTFKARQISERQVQVMKFIGGLIMILLGLVLLVNPTLIGLGLG